jgi:hypothetical protein
VVVFAVSEHIPDINHDGEVVEDMDFDFYFMASVITGYSRTSICSLSEK